MRARKIWPREDNEVNLSVECVSHNTITECFYSGPESVLPLNASNGNAPNAKVTSANTAVTARWGRRPNCCPREMSSEGMR